MAWCREVAQSNQAADNSLPIGIGKPEPVVTWRTTSARAREIRMLSAHQPVTIATVGGVPTLSSNAAESLASASLYFLCLLAATLLLYRLRKYGAPRDAAAECKPRRRAFVASSVAACLGGLMLILVPMDQVIPDPWRGRAMFGHLLPEYDITPVMAESASLETREQLLQELRDAIAAGVASHGIPNSRDEIDWIPHEQWLVPGIPGYAYTYTPHADGFELSEPAQIDGRMLSDTWQQD